MISTRAWDFCFRLISLLIRVLFWEVVAVGDEPFYVSHAVSSRFPFFLHLFSLSPRILTNKNLHVYTCLYDDSVDLSSADARMKLRPTDLPSYLWTKAKVTFLLLLLLLMQRQKFNTRRRHTQRTRNLVSREINRAPDKPLSGPFGFSKLEETKWDLKSSRTLR